MKQSDNIKNANYNGAKWVKVDLHLHTPSVETFKLPAGINLNSKEDSEQLAKKYIEKLQQAKIKVGAITDYNHIDRNWFELLIKNTNRDDIVILPGVELSLKLTGGKYGLHLLLIFEQDIDIDGLNTFLHSLDKNPQMPLVNIRKSRDIESRMELKELIDETCNKYKCLIIFPHPEDEKGLLHSFNASQAAQYLSSIKPDAIELISNEGINKLISTGSVSSDYFEKIAIIENTDPKSLEDIGSKRRNSQLRTTYYKLSSYSIGAIKLALHDPKVRIKVYECPTFYYDKISSLKINGAGFLGSKDIQFNSELNTLIGGRGVGKSAIIESIRYAMNLPVYADKSFRVEFVENVVGSGGEIELFIERYYGEKKQEFIIKRTIGKDTEIVDKSGKTTGFSVQSLFDEAKYPIIIGQKELYQLSITPSFQLELIDKLIGKSVLYAQDNFEKSIEQLRENGKKLLVLRDKVRKKEEYEQKLKEIEARIKVYKDLGVEEKLKKWTDLLDDEEKLEDVVKKVNDACKKVDLFFEDTIVEFNYLNSTLRTGKSVNKQIMEKIADEINNIKTILGNNKKQLIVELNVNKKSIDNLHKEWFVKKVSIEKEIQMVKKELSERKLEPDKLEYLTKERAKLIPLIEESRKLAKEIEKLENSREATKSDIEKKRHSIFSIRKEQLDKINQSLNGKMKIEVKYEAEKVKFGEKLKALLQGSRVSSDAIDALINAPNKVVDGLLLSKYIKEGITKLSGEFNLTTAMINRIIDWFSNTENLYELETLFPEDKIEIFLNINGEYKTMDRLSIGQKATSLLLLLFVQEDRILILDQPEEDLDNRFIYEDVVKLLRELKGKRQLIIATHNANIPVLGDSELIIVLDTKDEKCAVNNKGSIDKNDIKNDVKNIMEGGEEAFRIRTEKYGGI